jgi:MoaE-MoaD fusion protein
MIAIKVRFFGECRELAGAETMDLQISSASVGAAMEMIVEQCPAMKKFASRLLTAVNEDYAMPATRLSDGDTLAVFPPVSGGASEDIVALTHDPIEARELVRLLLRGKVGAVATFEGIVRDRSMGKQVISLEYEAYEPMALKMIEQIAGEIHDRWPVDRVGIVHRLGRLDVGETSVVIVITSAHRHAALEACHYAIDRLKMIVPIWKRECFQDGAAWAE